MAKQVKMGKSFGPAVKPATKFTDMAPVEPPKKIGRVKREVLTPPKASMKAKKIRKNPMF